MINIAICDDNSLHRDMAADTIRTGADLEGAQVSLSLFSGGDTLLAALAEGQSFQVAVLDIMMDGMDGISLAKQLNSADGRCQIIYLTGYVGYVMDVYESAHAYLVLKSAMRERLWPAVVKAMAMARRQAGQYLNLRTRVGMNAVAYEDILYLERKGRRTVLRTVRGEATTGMGLEELGDELRDGPFIRCHNSFIVNVNAVRRLDKDCFIVADGSLVPISRTYKKTACDAFWTIKNASALERML